MRYVLAFALIVALLLFVVWWVGGLAFLLIWPALNFLFVSAGYLFTIPKLFGKRPNGKIPLWSRILFLPYFILAHLIFTAARHLLSENPFDRICDDLVLGRRLLPSEVPAGLVNYLDVTAEFEDHESIKSAHHFLSVAVLDGDIPTIDEVHQTLAALKPGDTFVHCAQGHGRSALFSLAILLHRGLVKDVEEGLALLKEKRPGVNLNPKQQRFAREQLSRIG